MPADVLYIKFDANTYVADTANGLYEIQREGSGWGVYWEGSRFAGVNTVDEAKAQIESSVSEATER